MARKILNRKELREENDVAEKAEAVPKPAVKKAPAKRKRRQGRQRGPPEGLLGRIQPVFAANLTVRVQPRPEADKKASELTESQKSPHFVQLVKEVIEE